MINKSQHDRFEQVFSYIGHVLLGREGGEKGGEE